MTALTTNPAPALGAPRPHLVDVPTDHRLQVRGRRRDTHRFPAATYLCRSVAREERAVAQQALEATDRSASRRIGGLGGGVALLFIAAIVALVAVLRSHEREHDVLAERVRMYDARLLELRPRR